MGVIVKLRRAVPAIAVVLAFPVVGSPASASVTVPSGEMGFEVELDMPTQTPTPDCTPGITDIGMQIMAGGSADMTCKTTIVSSDQASTGKVSNPTLAAADPGFAAGSLAQTCDGNQQVETSMTVSRTSSTMKSFEGKVWQACTWKMEFPDAQKSTMTGTIEMNGTLGSDDGSVVDNAVQMSFTAKVFVVSGTGAFNGYTGGGEMTREEMVDLGLARAGGGGGSTPSTTPPPTGGTDAAMQQFCTANGISPCNQTNLGQFCSANPARCAPRSVSSQSAGVSAARVVARSVRAFASETTMTLSLKKGAGVVRILSPAPPAGQPTGTANVTKSTRIEIAATPGASCQVKTNRGKVVAARKVPSSGTVVLKPKSGSMKGASSIRAFCKVGTKSISSNLVKIKER